MVARSRPIRSIAVAARRIIGMVGGWISSPWAVHSAAIASARTAVGAVSGAPPGVRIGRPSSATP